VQMTEVHIPDDNDLCKRLTDMRLWLDARRCKPSTFLESGMKIRVTFGVEKEAEAFAQEFCGTLLDTQGN